MGRFFGKVFFYIEGYCASISVETSDNISFFEKSYCLNWQVKKRNL